MHPMNAILRGQAQVSADEEAGVGVVKLTVQVESKSRNLPLIRLGDFGRSGSQIQRVSR